LVETCSLRWKATFVMLGVKVREFYQNKKCYTYKMKVCSPKSHIVLFCSCWLSKLRSNKRELLHFVVILYLLAHGKLMINFENMKSLLKFFNMKNFPKKHWWDNSSWGMVKSPHTIIMQATMPMVHNTNYVVLFCDEKILVNNQFWLSIHVYIIHNWTMVPILMSLEGAMDGFNAIDLKMVII